MNDLRNTEVSEKQTSKRLALSFPLEARDDSSSMKRLPPKVTACRLGP